MSIFKRRHHNEKCSRKGWLGCNCGDAGKGRSKAEQGLADVGNKVAQSTAATPQETSQYQGSFDIGNLLNQIYKYQQGLGNAPSGYLDSSQQFLRNNGEIGQNYYNQVKQGSENPYGAFESSFQPALQQAQDSINTYYQRRGLLNSGLAIEGMGRAGVDLSIKEAQARMAAREQELARTAGFLDTAYGQSQNNLGNLSNLYQFQQNQGQQAMGRQAQGAAQAGQYYAYPYQARLGDSYGRSSALYALPGQLLNAAGNAASGKVG